MSASKSWLPSTGHRSGSSRIYTACPEFRRFLKRLADALVVFEPTSTYSRRLETLCRMQQISCCQLNPRVVSHLRQVGKGRSKTDRTDAELLYRYGIERGYGEAVQLARDSLAESIQARLACYRVAQKARASLTWAC